MKKILALMVGAAALAFAASASASLAPGVYDPGNTGCPTASFDHGVLHLAKNCPTPTNAAAGADINGFTGQTFQSASFTLANTGQCNGGSPRFDVVTSNGTFFLGCNNVTPSVASNGAASYTFTAAAIAAGGNQVPVPTGAISSVDVLIDVGPATADLSNITFNGQVQAPVPSMPTSKDQCKNGGWRSFTHPVFKNQGQCVSFFEHLSHHEGPQGDEHHSAANHEGDGHGKDKGHGHHGHHHDD